MPAQNDAHSPLFTLDFPGACTPGEGVSERDLDPLTKALTRPAFLGRLAREKRLTDERGSTFVCCLVDVDRLKSINDRHGQRTGDAVLVEVANRLRQVLRGCPGSTASPPAIARYDGDAFFVCVRDQEPADAWRLAETLRARIAGAPVVADLAVSVSIGVAEYRIGEHVDGILARSERALHLAKQFGPDRVEILSNPRRSGPRASVRPLRS